MPQIITNSMPLGSPGDLTRDVRECTIEAYLNSTTVPLIGFGLPVKLGAQAMSVTGFAGGETNASLLGFSVREYPSYPGGSMQNLAAGAGVPMAGAVGVLKKGYIAVQVGGVTTAINKESAVYVRVAAAAGGKPIGGIEGVADSTNTVQLTGAQFMGPVDSTGMGEIRFNV